MCCSVSPHRKHLEAVITNEGFCTKHSIIFSMYNTFPPLSFPLLHIIYDHLWFDVLVWIGQVFTDIWWEFHVSSTFRNVFT